MIFNVVCGFGTRMRDFMHACALHRAMSSMHRAKIAMWLSCILDMP